MLTQKRISEVLEVLSPDDFYRPSHGTLFSVMVEMDQAGRAIDAITLADEVEKRGLAGEMPRSRIHELAALVPATANVLHYAKLVHEHAVLRGLIAAGQRIARLGFDRPGELSELLAEAEALLSSVTLSLPGSGSERLDTSVEALRADLAAMVSAGRTKTGLSTGFYDLDQLTTGLYPGSLILLAARPGMGKTVLGTNIAETVADRGTPSAIFSLEMVKEELALRSLSRATGLPTQALRSGKLTPHQYRQYQEATIVSDRPLYVDDDPMSIHDVRSKAIRLRRRHGIELLVVDYLQLVTPPRIESREQQISVISRSLKSLAKELRIPVIAISQLNRAVEHRENKRPTLADLRDSGSLEQDADLILFIYRDDYYDPSSPERGIAELQVAKHRMGPHGVVKLKYAGERSAFLNLGRE